MRLKGTGFWLVLCALAVAGCTSVYVTGPSQNNVQVIGANPGASPSPGGSNGVVSTVTIAEFGERCPAGKAPAEDAPRQVRVGCTSAVTVNPRGPDGKVIFDVNLTGAAPESFEVVSGNALIRFSISEANAYNADVTGLSPGTAQLQARVKGVTSAPWDVEVVP